MILVRHAAIEESYKTRCYGASDVPLSETGQAHSREIASQLAAELATVPQPILLLHSGLSRTRFLAEILAQQVGLPLIEDPRIRELNFGNWELKPWDEIHAQTGDSMVRLVDEPDTFAPDGGETIHAMRDRMLDWHASLPSTGTIVAITHGGPIAALRGALAGWTVHQWLSLIPAHGSIVSIEPPEPLPPLDDDEDDTDIPESAK